MNVNEMSDAESDNAALESVVGGPLFRSNSAFEFRNVSVSSSVGVSPTTSFTEEEKERGEEEEEEDDDADVDVEEASQVLLEEVVEEDADGEDADDEDDGGHRMANDVPEPKRDWKARSRAFQSAGALLGDRGRTVARELYACVLPQLARGREDEGGVGAQTTRSQDSATRQPPQGDDSNASKKRASVHNFLRVPLRLEALLALNLVVCLDEFLAQFTVLPVRCVIFLHRRTRGREMDGQDSAQAAVDLVHLSLLLLTSLSLWFYNISWVYHNIRGQNVIKLYVIFNIVEIFDRLCSSFGMDVFDMLGSSLAEVTRFFAYEDWRLRKATGRSLVLRLSFDYLVSLLYSFVHATLILAWVMTLNVTVNSSGNTILVLLVSNNFVELKSVALKHFRVQNVFQIACSDSVERFQIFIFLSTILAYTRGDRRVLVTWVVVFGFELVVDWIKHAFAAKFNSISHEAYKTFSLVICRDLIASKRHSFTTSIGGSSVSKRLGFVSLPISAFTLRMLGSILVRLPAPATVLLFATLFVIKATTAVGLLGHCYKRVQQYRAKPRMEEEEKLIQQLANVHRYTVRKD